MNTMTHPQNNIADDERDAFRKALVIYYSGEPRIADAFAQVEPGLIDRYYRRKKKFPDEIKAIDAEARAEARWERSRKRTTFEAGQTEQSMEMQRWAAEALKSVLPELRRIVMGKPKEVYDADGNLVKTLIVYPRDQLDAMRSLLNLARTGVMPEGFKDQPALAAKEQPGFNLPLLPLAPFDPNFTSVSATRPDGTRFTATVEKEGVIISELDDKTEDEEGTDEPAADHE